jgi:putative phage-type endonuclease
VIEQGTAEWHAQRVGKATASKMSCVMANGKGGEPSKTRANYLAQLVCERMTGQPTEGFKSKSMERGNEVEPEAREAYTFMFNATVARVGFVDHPHIAMSGASPDSYVGEDGLLEIKCPDTTTHLDTLLGGPISKAYKLQMQWQMACTGRQWVDFCSYDNRLPEHLRLHVQRIDRDQKIIIELETEVVAFLKEVTAQVARLDAMKTQPTEIAA